jgi:hypothetical protein
MRNASFLLAYALLIAGAAPPPAGVVQSPSATGSAAAAQSDPMQRVICEKQNIVGSRLAVKKVCKTRAQWDDERLQTRQEIDKQQTMRGRRDDG